MIVPTSPGEKSRLRDCISSDDSEIAVFACDIASQPQYDDWVTHDPLLFTKCSRALAIACSNDVVVLSGKLDGAYRDWLRSLDLGPREVVTYGFDNPTDRLADIIRKNPAPLEEALGRVGKSPVYVPFYCSEREVQLCQDRNWALFGCDESITLQFFNKTSFKEQCDALAIPTVGGTQVRKDSQGECLSGSELESVLLALLHQYPSLVIRGALGAAGKSVYHLDDENLIEVLEAIQKDRGQDFLAEPFLDVIASPNDQWSVSRDGTIRHLGISAQLFTGLKHEGNLKGQYFSSRVVEQIEQYSGLVARQMASVGYRGVFGVDYIVSDNAVLPIENNARFNGSTFAIGIVDRLEDRLGTISSWKFFKAVTSPCTFNELKSRIAPLLYDGLRINSVFPFDCDELSHNGSFAALLVAEDLYHIDYLERTLQGLGVMRP